MYIVVLLNTILLEKRTLLSETFLKSSNIHSVKSNYCMAFLKILSILPIDSKFFLKIMPVKTLWDHVAKL